MPFGLKNTGFTYQRMMTRMFEPRLGKNIEAYIDDMVVKSKMVSTALNYFISRSTDRCRPLFQLLNKWKIF